MREAILPKIKYFLLFLKINSFCECLSVMKIFSKILFLTSTLVSIETTFSHSYAENRVQFADEENTASLIGEDSQKDGTSDQPALSAEVQVQIEYQLSGGYQQLFNKEKDKYEVFLKAFSDDKPKGTKPVRISLDKEQAQFNNQLEESPKKLLVALSKKGTTYQHFCTGKDVNEGIINAFPKQILIKLTNANSPYKAADNSLRNDSYPNCEVIIK